MLAGVLPDEKIREHALQQLGGRNLPVPGVDGLDVDFRAQHEDLDDVLPRRRSAAVRADGGSDRVTDRAGWLAPSAALTYRRE